MIYGDALEIEAHIKQANTSSIKCLVTTISDTIIKVDCAVQLDPEKPVTLKMRGMNILTARLLWKRYDEYGCQIDYSLHPAVIQNMIERLDTRRKKFLK